jgi:hypothetical protein
MPKNISHCRWLLCLVAIAAWLVSHSATVHAQNKNPELDALVQTGVQMPSGQGRRLPPPTMKDGLNAAAQKQVILGVLAVRKGKRVSYDEFVQKGWNSPNVLLVDDARMSSGQPGHSIDLWFVVYGQLKTVADPKFMKSQFKPDNQGRIDTLQAADLQQRNIMPRTIPGGKEWFVHGKFKMMETDVRVQVQGTCRAVDTQSGESAIMASQIDRRFDRDTKYPNDWCSVTNGVVQNDPTLYYSFGGYAKVTKLIEPAGTLFVEYHLVYDEPTAWFGGHQLLQTKFPAVTLESVRSFRRDVRDAESGGQ